MVRVSCMTYNHAPYIKDAMDGFCMQETNFPFVCTIIDDASTDGEQEVIKNYLKAHFDLEDSSVVRNEETDDYYLIFARHTTNKNCFFAVLLLKYNHYSIKKPKMSYLLKEWRDTKYVAICEGDDYWTDEHKLEKQVNWLETHLEYSACLHDTIQRHLIDSNYEVLLEKDVYETKFLNLKKNCDMSATDAILCKYWPHTSSILIHRNIHENKPACFVIRESGDWQLFMYATFSGKVRLMKEVMSVYRKGVEGSFTVRMGHNQQSRIDHMINKIEMLQKVDDYYGGKYKKPILEAINKMKYNLTNTTGNQEYLLDTPVLFRIKVYCKQIIKKIVKR